MYKQEMKTNSDVNVRPIKNNNKINEFIRLQWRLYADDPAWIAPLKLERRLHLSALNPFSKHGRWQGWIAYRNNIAVGRISAQIDDLHQQTYGRHCGHFGFLEGIEDAEVFSALTKTAESWLLEQGASYITGPMGFSLNQECGLLVEGFEHPPVVMMPHARPWYAPMLEAQGYIPVKDLLAYWINVDFEATKTMTLMLGRYEKQVRVRTLDRARFSEEMELLRALFNDAWSENWGFVPFTEAEFAELGTSLRLLVPDEYIQIAEVEGQAAAFIVALPNINEITRDLNGSLLPTGWLKLLWRVKQKQAKTGRVPLMGVRKQFQNSPLGMALAFQVIDAVRQQLYANGIKEVEMSWILEDNSGMRKVLESTGGKIYKRYRLYHKTLSASAEGKDDQPG